MNLDSMLAMGLGAIIGFAMIQGMIWLVRKVRLQSRSTGEKGITRTPDGSILIRPVDGEDLFITGTFRAGDGVGTKRKGGYQGSDELDAPLIYAPFLPLDDEPEDEAANLKRNLLD